MQAALIEALKLVQWGSATGWWGVSCPAHCSSNPFVALATLLAGFFLGSLLTVLGGLWLFFGHPHLVRPAPPEAASPVASAPDLRLSAYLYERRRRHLG